MGRITFAIEYRRQLGSRVRRYRKEQRLSQEQLGLMIDMDRASISRLENGRGNTTLDTIVALANALGVSPSALLEGIADPMMNASDPRLSIVIPERKERFALS